MNGPGTEMRATPVLPRRDRRGDTGMIPLINVVLLLLIFFLLAGRLDDGRDRRCNPRWPATGGAWR